MRSRRRAASERGLATIWVLTWCGLLCAMTAAGMALAQVVILRHHLSSAADSAALAAAGTTVDGDGCRTAARIATAHGVRLDRCDIDGDGSTVTVRVSAPTPGLVGGVIPRMTGQARAGPP
ncbi:MAG: Rv3654c family TadE-like protein [Candidatus Nanopelagicales bacterium]